jgi:hypothetical protein
MPPALPPVNDWGIGSLPLKEAHDKAPDHLRANAHYNPADLMSAWGSKQKYAPFCPDSHILFQNSLNIGNWRKQCGFPAFGLATAHQ